jgi:hypothetical protein
MAEKEKDPLKIGQVAHTAILHKLVSMGFEVLRPLSHDLRYDLAYYVAETAELVRIQCKAGRYMPKMGFIIFKNFNRTGGHTEMRGYVGDVEYFGVYSPDTKKVYLVPVNESSAQTTSLRLKPTGKIGKNQFSMGVRWAKDYELE